MQRPARPHSRRHAPAAPLLLLCAFFAAPAARPASADVVYEFQTLTHNDQSLTPYAITSSGIVVGQAADKRPFFVSQYGYGEVALPAGEEYAAYVAINDSGLGIVLAGHTDPQTHLDVRHTYSSAMGFYDTPDPDGLLYHGVNGDRQRVGTLTGPGGASGVIDGSTYAVPGSNFTYLTGISNVSSGATVITGYFLAANGSAQGFYLVSAGGAMDLKTVANASNLFPQCVVVASGPGSFGFAIAGYYRDTGGKDRGFLVFPPGPIQIVNVPHSTGTEIYGISDAGTLVGTYTDANGVQAGFIATVAPPYSMDELVSVIQIASGMDTFAGYAYPPRYDVDGDGHVTLKDAARIMRKIAGLDPNP